MTTTLTIEREVHFQPPVGGAQAARVRPRAPPPGLGAGRVAAVAGVMALAIRFGGLVGDGVVKGYAELAGLGHGARGRISQVMALLSLAPDLQEAVLF